MKRKKEQIDFLEEKPVLDFDNPSFNGNTEEHTSGTYKLKKTKNTYICYFQGCNQIFTTKANRNRHELLHTGSKPFGCDFEGCGKSFARKYDLKVHHRTHTKEKPYKCEIFGCGKKFSRSSTQREHERIIHHVDKRIMKQNSQEKLDDSQSTKPDFDYKKTNHQQQVSLKERFYQQISPEEQFYQKIIEEQFQIMNQEQKLVAFRERQEQHQFQLSIPIEFQVHELVNQFHLIHNQPTHFNATENDLVTETWGPLIDNETVK